MTDIPTDPHDLFRTWFAEAREMETNDPNAMALATVDGAWAAVVAHGAVEGA